MREKLIAIATDLRQRADLLSSQANKHSEVSVKATEELDTSQALHHLQMEAHLTTRATTLLDVASSILDVLQAEGESDG